MSMFIVFLRVVIFSFAWLKIWKVMKTIGQDHDVFFFFFKKKKKKHSLESQGQVKRG